MTNRVCESCDKAFRTPADLRRHLARKTPCAPILEEEDRQNVYDPEVLGDPDLEKKKCRFCGRIFSSYDSMRRHVRKYCKIAPNEKNGDAGMEKLYEHTLRKQQAQIANLEAIVMRQTALMEQLVLQGGECKPAPQQAGEVAIQNRGGQVAVDNKKITINVFGKENLDHITAARIRKILDNSLRNTRSLQLAISEAILSTAFVVFSDGDYPENIVCFSSNKKTDDAMIHTGRGWEICSAKLLLPKMATRSIDALFGKQPYENAEQYAPLMKELRDNEAAYATGDDMRPVLVRNKGLLKQRLETLPVAGDD